MSRPMPVLLLASWLAAPGLALAQDALTPEKIALIRRDEQAALDRVNERYGNRKPSEMTSEERRQSIQDQQQAMAAVLEKHEVSDKQYARHVARMSLAERDAVTAAAKQLEAEAQAAREAAQNRPPQPEEIPIQNGISDQNPVELESVAGAPAVVEQGLPPGEVGLEQTEGAVDIPPATAPEASPTVPTE
ncbi:hypothetical protein [Stigmatella aurantiaca]|uniref:DUF4168 domain-containing protein n=1 Tax=Stigmatella aurantiaca (strain DW4/3-1) TaxID=378806 RepID=E3FSM1_STIAD|nr:hypothetical protein [Stigmatella aurantiaca]ADO73317.1 uncharacterized protein STAUR_5547 [Stigmatella aurantiaca DW4/3-1]